MASRPASGFPFRWAVLDGRRHRPSDGTGAVIRQRQRQRKHLNRDVGGDGGGALGEMIFASYPNLSLVNKNAISGEIVLAATSPLW